MDAISKAVGAYKACIYLPDDVRDNELGIEARKMLEYARLGPTLDNLKFEIATGLANRIRVATLNDEDCSLLAKALLELANVPGLRN